MSPSRPDDAPAPRRVLPDRPSLQQLRKQAKDLLHATHAGEAGAEARVRIGQSDHGARLTLARAQLAIAREYGFPSWPALVRHVEAIGGGLVRRPLIRPVELSPGRPYRLADGTDTTTDDVFAMFVAARDGEIESVRQLVARVPALATVEYNYTPPIHFAVREGHRHIVELLLDRGADPAYRSYPFQESLLTFADDRGYADIAELLRRRLSQRFALVSGTQAHHRGGGKGRPRGSPGGARRESRARPRQQRHGRYPAPPRRTQRAPGCRSGAARCGRGRGRRARRRLSARALRADAQLVLPGRTGAAQGDRRPAAVAGARHTIFVAALRGDDQFVRDALARDRSLANFEDTCHHRVLSAAVRRGDVAMTRLLLEHGADPNLPEEGAPRGLSLWIAVNDRQREIVAMLLEHGADPNAPVESSGTPMSQAAQDPELTALLRRHGGQQPTSDRDRVGRLVHEGQLEEAERLLRANPQWIHDDEAGWGDGILAGPAHDGRHDVIAMLLRLGARVPQVSKWAPYYYFKHEATAAFLLEHGMDPNHMNWHRFTLLHHMAAEGELGKARLLLDHGADIDAIDEEYCSTPLGVAARRGQDAVVALLLERGADPIAAGAPWATPLAWAEKRGHRRIAEMLLRVSD